MDNNILIIDDSPHALSETKRIVQNIDSIQVDTASSATEARKLQLENYKLVIVDVVMPEENGIEFARFLKEKFPLLKIILITSLEQERIQLESIQAGADDFHTKPLNEEAFTSSIKNLL